MRADSCRLTALLLAASLSAAAARVQRWAAERLSGAPRSIQRDLTPVEMRPYTPLDEHLMNTLPQKGPSSYLFDTNGTGSLLDIFFPGDHRPLMSEDIIPTTIFDYMSQVRDNAFDRGAVYSGFSLRDIETFIKTANDHIAYRFYDLETGSYHAYPKFSGKDALHARLRDYNGAPPRFLLRRGLTDRALEFIPMPKAPLPLIINYQGIVPMAENPVISEALNQALDGLHVTLKDLTASMVDNEIDELDIWFDSSLKALEETHVPRNGGSATLHLNIRLLEPGFEKILAAEIAKGLINVMTPFKQPVLKEPLRVPELAAEVKETATLPPFFTAWVEMAGLEGVRSGLKLLGPGAVPLADCFESIARQMAVLDGVLYFEKYAGHPILINRDGAKLDYMFADKSIRPLIDEYIMHMLRRIFIMDPEFLFKPEGDHFALRDLTPVPMGTRPPAGMLPNRKVLLTAV